MFSFCLSDEYSSIIGQIPKDNSDNLLSLLDSRHLDSLKYKKVLSKLQQFHPAFINTSNTLKEKLVHRISVRNHCFIVVTCENLSITPTISSFKKMAVSQYQSQIHRRKSFRNSNCEIFKEKYLQFALRYLPQFAWYPANPSRNRASFYVFVIFAKNLMRRRTRQSRD